MARKARRRTQLTFLGAAGTVTGSCYRVHHPGGEFLVDCGLFQGNKTLKELNYGPFPFNPAKIDFLLLTHAHIDHSGLIPKLCKHGFTGPIYATGATRDLLTFMLPDSGHIQESEVRRLNHRNQRRGRKTVQPIYTRADAEHSIDQIVEQEFDSWFEAAPQVRARYWNAGHILGAGSIEIELDEGRDTRSPLRMLFSGDIGPQEKAFHQNPAAPSRLDYLILESTYGDRDRDDISLEHRRAVLKKEIQSALDAGGNILIPAFAVERTQELLYDIGLLMADGDIPEIPVYLDSPLAVRATEVFETHTETLHAVERRGGMFRSPAFRFVTRTEDSIALSNVTSGVIIISASGMCDAGRIRHHLKNNLWRAEATVLFIGYQAPGTLGALLQRGEKRVRIQGDEIAVRARIRKIDTYSAHADQRELVDWACARMPIERGIFLTHGEEMALDTLRDHLVAAGCPAETIILPKLDEVFDLVPKRPPRRIAEAPRVAQEEAVGEDWHNEYASFLVHLAEGLQELPDDAARHRLLRQLSGKLKTS